MITVVRRSTGAAWVPALVLVAAGIGLVLGFGPVGVSLVMAAGLLAAVVGLTWYRPEWALLVVTAGLAIYPFFLAQAFVHGAPIQALGAAKFWKEVVLGVLAVRVLYGGWGQLDYLDLAALAFVGITAIYLVAPIWLVPIGPSLDARLVGAREDAAPLLLFVVCRHLPAGTVHARRILNVIMALALAVAMLAFVNFFLPTLWGSLVDISGIQPYTGLALDATAGAAVNYGSVGDVRVVRAGSIFLSALALAFFLMIPISIAAARIVYKRASWFTLLAGLACCAALFLTLTRTAIALLPLLGVIAVLAGRSKGRLGYGMLLAGVLLWPVLSSFNLFARFQSALDPTDPSTVGHLTGIQASITRMSVHPIGTGLGTAGSAARRFFVAESINNESWYFQIGTEMGVFAMAVYVLVVLAATGKLWRRARIGSLEATAALCGLVGIGLGGLVLHSFEDLATAWILWLLVGLALRPTSCPRQLAPAS